MSLKYKKLDLSFYEHEDVTIVAQKLLGKLLCAHFGGELTKGMIVETEAYSGDDDKACHANGQKKTKRNSIMFAQGGRAYVYLIYGIHHLFNVVTNREGTADAVLIRALEPVEGIDAMMRRRGLEKAEKRLTAGPGALTRALGITTDYYGTMLNGNLIWIEEGMAVPEDKIVSTTRIGVDYAGDDALKPWRYYIKENPWVSRYS